VSRLRVSGTRGVNRLVRNHLAILARTSGYSWSGRDDSRYSRPGTHPELPIVCRPEAVLVTHLAHLGARRKWARVALAGVAMLCIGIVLWGTVVAREPHDEKHLVEIAVLAMASLAMLSSLYMVLHWAFRPENSFSESFIVFASNPLGYLLTYWVRK